MVVAVQQTARYNHQEQQPAGLTKLLGQLRPSLLLIPAERTVVSAESQPAVQWQMIQQKQSAE